MTTGTGMLRVRYKQAMGTGVALAILFWSKSEQDSFSEMIQNVSRFWNKCKSYWEEETNFALSITE